MHSGLKKAIIFNFILGTSEQVLSRRCEDEVLHIYLNEVLSNGYFVSFKINVFVLLGWREMLTIFTFPHWQCNNWIITAWLSNTTCTFLYILAQAQEPIFVFCFHYTVTTKPGKLTVPSCSCVSSWTIVPHSVLFHLYKCPLLPLNDTTYTSSILWYFLYHIWCHPL